MLSMKEAAAPAGAEYGTLYVGSRSAGRVG